MDVAKYIGLFLLKNKFCYIHGLGNLELKKRTAAYEGESLNAPSYEVIVTPTGSIDDNLANFIATNEQISISKAANALREFSTHARNELAAGREVAIPSLGKFIQVNNRIQFITDPHMNYAPPPLPTVKMAPHAGEERRVYETSTSSTTEAATRNGAKWGKILLVFLLLGGLVAGIFFGVQYINNKADEQAEDTAETAPLVDTMMQAPVADTTAVDTAKVDTMATTQMPNGELKFKVLLHTYTDSAKANKRVNTLKGIGYNVQLVMRDTATYQIVLPVTAPAADTAKVIDSLKRNLNPKGNVRVLK